MSSISSDILITWWRVAEIALGVSLIYFKVCLYKDEADRLHNHLADLWFRIQIISDSMWSRSERLFYETNKLVRLFYERMLGHRLVSWQAVTLIGAYSLGWHLVVTDGWGPASTVLGPSLQGNASVAGAILLCIAVSHAVVRQRWILLIAGATTVLVMSSLIYEFALSIRALALWNGRPLEDITSALSVFVPVLASLFIAGIYLLPWLLDCLWISAHRKALLWAAERQIVWRTAIITTASMAIVFAFWHARSFVTLDDAEPDLLRVLFLIAIDISLPSRIPLAAIASLQAFIACLTVLHLLLWPVLARIVYAAEDYKFFKERKLFGTVGSALLLDALAGGRAAAFLARALG